MSESKGWDDPASDPIADILRWKDEIATNQAANQQTTTWTSAIGPVTITVENTVFDPSATLKPTERLRYWCERFLGPHYHPRWCKLSTAVKWMLNEDDGYPPDIESWDGDEWNWKGYRQHIVNMTVATSTLQEWARHKWNDHGRNEQMLPTEQEREAIRWLTEMWVKEEIGTSVRRHAAAERAKMRYPEEGRKRAVAPQRQRRGYLPAPWDHKVK